MGYLRLNVPGRCLRQRLLEQGLHMVARRPTILILPRPTPRRALRILPLSITPGTSYSPPMERRGEASTCTSAPGLPPRPPYFGARR